MTISTEQRDLWEKYRAGLLLDHRASENFGTGGLGHFLTELRARL